MKIPYYSRTIDNEYYLVSVPLASINYNELIKSYYNLKKNISLDDYTLSGFKRFYYTGFTEERVSNAPIIKDEDQMILFAYDPKFNSPVGLAICFNGKFYAMDYKEGRRSESELYNIYKSKRYKI